MVSQRPRKPGLKAPPRVEHIAHPRAPDEPVTDEAVTEGRGTGEATDDALSEVTEPDDGLSDATGQALPDAADVDEASPSDVQLSAPGDRSPDAGHDDPSGPPTDFESLDMSAATDDPASLDPGDPLAAMLAEFDAPRPVVPGVQLTEEIPIDPEDDLRAVEGEASLRLVSILESLLFAAARPLRVQDLRKVLAETSKHQIQLALKHLMAVTRERGVVLAQVAGGFQYRTHPDNAVWVQKMLQAKPARLSRTQIETLAIVAYRQPITRPEIDDVRGVDSGAVLKTLLERELIQIVGRKEEPGRPLLYGTTVRFLEFFNLRSLRDLPTLRDFRDLSEESKATVRAKFGESEAEALGQGVLGLDSDAGDAGDAGETGEAPTSAMGDRLDESADEPATDAAREPSEHPDGTAPTADAPTADDTRADSPDASSHADADANEETTDAAPQVTEHLEAAIELAPLDAVSEPGDATESPDDATESPDDASTPKSPDDASTPKSPDDASTPVSPDDASTPESPDDASTPVSPDDATASADDHGDPGPTDLESDPAPSATSESAPAPELTTDPAVLGEPGSESPPDAVEASQPEPAHADDERLIDDVER